MIQFSETMARPPRCRAFTVTEDEKSVGTGTLAFFGRRVEIGVVAADGTVKDFLLRGLLNVLSAMGGMVGVLSNVTAEFLGGEAYLAPFGFTKAPGLGYTVEAGEIRLNGKCKI